MATAGVNIRIDPVLKQEAQTLFESLGLNLSTAVNIFLRQAVREQAIPFRVGDSVPNVKTAEKTDGMSNDICLKDDQNGEKGNI